MRAAIRFLGELIRAWKHRRAHWYVKEDRVVGACMGDWREVIWGCNACGEEIIGTSDLSIADDRAILRKPIRQLMRVRGMPATCPGRLTIAGEFPRTGP